MDNQRPDEWSSTVLRKRLIERVVTDLLVCYQSTYLALRPPVLVECGGVGDPLYVL